MEAEWCSAAAACHVCFLLPAAAPAQAASWPVPAYLHRPPNLATALPPDCAADDGEAKYDLAFKSKDNDGSQKKSGAEMADFYQDLCSKYPIISIEVGAGDAGWLAVAGWLRLGAGWK